MAKYAKVLFFKQSVLDVMWERAKSYGTKKIQKKLI